MTSRWEQYKEKNGVTPLDLLNPKTARAEKSLSDKRLEICRSCPELIQLTTQCKQCGCIMKIKTGLEAAICPIGKWGAETKNANNELEYDIGDKTIFVNIPSYKDPEIWLTVKDFFKQAKYPERIFFGITIQSDDPELDLSESKNLTNVSVDIVEPGSIVGCQPARKNSHQFYKNQDYYLNMDSHMRSIPNWDIEIIREYELEKLESNTESVFTGYVPQYEIDENGIDQVNYGLSVSPTFFMSESNVTSFMNNGVPQFTPQYTNPGKNVFSPYVSGHFFFTERKVIETVPFMSEVTFTEEEPFMALRFFTAGFNLVTPHKAFIFHRYGRNGRKLFWEDFPEKFYPEHDKSNKYFLEVVETNKIDKLNGLLGVRSLEDYEKYSGISFNPRTLDDGVVKGLPSGSF